MDINRRYPGNSGRNHNFLVSHINGLKVFLTEKLYMGSHQLIQCSSADSRQELMLWGKYVKQEKYKMVISIVQSLRCCQLVVKKVPEPDVARE